ncbi:MAG: hypothetical protein ABL962_13250 [Fimbriimonadaceae bacterium]
MFESMMAGPKPLVKVLIGLIGFLLALILALTMIVQWVFWLGVTMKLWNGYGMAIGITVFAAQILLIFQPTKKAESCDI